MSTKVDSRLFTGGEQIDRLQVLRGVGTGPNGVATAMLLEGPGAGSIFEEIAIPEDDSAYTFSVDVKPGTSPSTQIVLHYLGAMRKTYYMIIDMRSMTAAGDSEIGRRQLGEGWYRFSLSGVNSIRGSCARAQIYPHYGGNGESGSVFIANARLFWRPAR